MKLAFKIDEVETKSGSRRARGRLTKKFLPRGLAGDQAVARPGQ